MQNTRYKIQDTRYKKGFTLLNNLRSKLRFKKSYLTGFTLVEALVGVAVFTLVMGVASGLFVHVLQSQRKVLAYQEVLDQTSFIMEYMTRGIRMAKKQRAVALPVACIATVGHNYQLVSSNHLKFIRWDHLEGVAGAFVCYEFFLEGTTLKVRRDGAFPPSPLTSPKLEVTTLKFEVMGDAHPEEIPSEQPRVTIVLEVRGREYDPGRRPIIHLQTTVSQRDLDF